jgi:hypothetical protein
MSFGYPQWSPFTTYNGGDTVGYNGLAYVANAIVSGTAPLPANAFWSLITPTGGGGGGGDITQWSTYPAVSDVVVSSFNVTGVSRTDTGIVRVGVIDPELGGSYVQASVDISGASDFLAGDDVKSRWAQPNQTSLNDVYDRASGIVSYNSGSRITTFESATPPFLIGQGVQVNGTINALFDVTAGNGLYSLSTLGSLLPGLLAKLDSVLIGYYLPTVANYSLIGTPSNWVPNQSPPEAGGIANGWRFTKAAGGAGGTKKMNWFPYNPVYGQSIPYTIPVGSNFLKNQLEALWIVITPTININVQGVIFFNIYTYDYSNPPTPPSEFTNRFDYCCNNLALPLTTGGLTLQSGFKYLLCCVDADKIVATPGSLPSITNCNGQFPSQTQTTKLRDPIDIHTSMPHITMTAVSYNTGVVPFPPADPSQVYVSQFAISTTSSAVAAGLDFTIHSIGYRANGTSVEYNFAFS